MPQQITDLPWLDYDDPDYHKEPFLWLANQASQYEIARSERGVEILEYNLARSMLMHKALGTDHANLVKRMALPESRALTFKQNMLLTHNRGSTRQRLRKVLMGMLGPGQSESMRGNVRQTVSSLLDGLPDGECDLKLQFTDLLPASVYCGWVDAPLSDARFIADMSETVLSIFQRDPTLTPTIVAAYEKLFSYARKRIDERESALGEDFLSRLIGFRNTGELSEQELEDFAVMLIEASTDNTSHQLAITVDRLWRIPGVWQQLSAQPELVAGAVQEVMRLWPRSISTSRTALEDMVIADVSIPKGTSLFASFGACHRQGDVFADARSFNAQRGNHPSHLNFGGGPFSCLGQFIATIEIEEAIKQLTARYPALEIINAETRYTAMFQTVPSLVVRAA